MDVIDVHCHFWTRVIDGRNYIGGYAAKQWFKDIFCEAEPVLDADAEKLIQALDAAEASLGGTYRACVFGLDLGNFLPMEVSVAQLNNWVLAQARKDTRGRLIPFGCIDPTRDITADEARRCVRELGMRGFKLLPPSGFYPSDSRALPFYEEVVRLQEEVKHPLPILVHQGWCWSNSKFANPIHIEEVAVRFRPHLKLILAHAGIPWVNEALSIAAINRNVYLDISLYGDLYGFWPELHMKLFGKAKRAGVLDRILFGSDWPQNLAWMKSEPSAPRWTGLETVVKKIAGIKEMPRPLLEMGYPHVTEQEVKNIFSANAAPLLGKL